MNKASKLIIMLIALAAAVFIAVGASAPRPYAKAFPSSVEEAETERYWKSRVEAVGVEKTYAELKEYASDKDFGTGHTMAHIFGKVLYDAEGLKGFSVCDGSLSFGCYHSFLGRAVASLGTAAIPELAKECHDIYGDADTGCKHGIGHGIMEYKGRGNLLQALDLCKETGQVQPLFGCTSGLFMEYNSAMMFRDGQAYMDVRSVDPKKPYAPCDSLESSDFRESCYFEIGLLWKQTYGNDFNKIAALCSALPSKEDVDACAQGWGTIVAENVDYDLAKAREACGLMKQAHAAQACKLGVVMRFNGDGAHGKEARELCKDLGDVRPEECGRGLDL